MNYRTLQLMVRVELSKERKYVDLGLPSGTLWADRNVGADSPEKFGDCFTWDDAIEEIDGIPSIEQFQELMTCAHVWATVRNVEGLLFTGPNGNTLFVPASYCHGIDVGSGYWSSSLNDRCSDYAQQFSIYSPDYSGCMCCWSSHPCDERKAVRTVKTGGVR
jgi:hypothetical protein